MRKKNILGKTSIFCAVSFSISLLLHFRHVVFFKSQSNGPRITRYLTTRRQWFSTSLSSRHTKHEKQFGSRHMLIFFEKGLENEFFYKLQTKSPYFSKRTVKVSTKKLVAHRLRSTVLVREKKPILGL